MTVRIRTFHWRWEVKELTWFPHILYELELVLVRIWADFRENYADIVLRAVLLPTNWIASNHSFVNYNPVYMNSSRNKNKRRDFRGEAALSIRLSVVSTVVRDLDSQSQPSLSSSQDNVSVSGQSKKVLSDLWKDPYTTQSHPLRTDFLRSCQRIFSRCSRQYRQRTKAHEQTGRIRSGRVGFAV